MKDHSITVTFSPLRGASALTVLELAARGPGAPLRTPWGPMKWWKLQRLIYKDAEEPGFAIPESVHCISGYRICAAVRFPSSRPIMVQHLQGDMASNTRGVIPLPLDANQRGDPA